jgi:hypothetical protein
MEFFGKCLDNVHKPWDHVYDHSITQDELDYGLKSELRMSPE